MRKPTNILIFQTFSTLDRVLEPRAIISHLRNLQIRHSSNQMVLLPIRTPLIDLCIVPPQNGVADQCPGYHSHSDGVAFDVSRSLCTGVNLRRVSFGLSVGLYETEVDLRNWT